MPLYLLMLRRPWQERNATCQHAVAVWLSFRWRLNIEGGTVCVILTATCTATFHLYLRIPRKCLCAPWLARDATCQHAVTVWLNFRWRLNIERRTVCVLLTATCTATFHLYLRIPSKCFCAPWLAREVAPCLAACHGSVLDGALILKAGLCVFFSQEHTTP